MKRLLLVLVSAICLTAIVGTAGADSFQEYTSDSFLSTYNMTHDCWGDHGCPGHTVSMTYSDNTSGGNDRVLISDAEGNNGFTSYSWTTFGLDHAQASTYAAVTQTSSTGIGTSTVIHLLNSDESVLYFYNGGYGWEPAANARLEVKITGGFAYFYENGVYKAKSTPLATPAYFIKFGRLASTAQTATGYYDDYVYGQDSNKYSFDAPSSGYCIRKDILNSALDGLTFCNNDTVVSTNYMFARYGKASVGSSGETSGSCTNETVVLQNHITGTQYETHYTGTNCAEEWNWDIKTNLIDVSAPNGLYSTTIPGSGTTSEQVPMINGGASIDFDKEQYSQQDTATMSYTILDDYWTPGTYSYKVMLLDGTDYTAVQNSTVTTQTGSATYTFTEDDGVGVYYAVLILTDSSTGTEYWLDLDYAELDAYVTFQGYVMNETGMVLPGANVSIVQGSTASNTITPAAGNYTATGFFTGGLTSFNVTATGYNQYYAELIPLAAKTVDLNFTLVSLTPSYTGLGIGGVARDGNLEGDTITLGYGRPIEGATVYLQNTSNSESYTKTTNIAGFYLCDEGASCFLTNNRPYDVWGEKLGYDNSANYTVVASG